MSFIIPVKAWPEERAWLVERAWFKDPEMVLFGGENPPDSSPWLWVLFRWYRYLNKKQYLYQEFRSVFNFIKLNQNCRYPKKILHISGVIDSTKKQTTFWKSLDLGSFVIIYSRILPLKLGVRINSNYFKNQRSLSSRLDTFIFRGTPFRSQFAYGE